MRPSRRGTRRWSILWPAVLIREGTEEACTVLDISEYGARIEASGTAGALGEATLQCPQFGDIPGVVVWWRARQAGMRFHLSPAEVFDRLKAAVPGLNRKDPTLLTGARSGAPRSSFGRMPKGAS
jgi:hypothetical protein